MLGRSRDQDQAQPVKDRQDRFGAQTPYAIRWQFRDQPQYLTASNKPSEHNTGKIARYIPVSQLRGTRAGNQTIRTMVSHKVHFRPGTQSLGGT